MQVHPAARYSVSVIALAAALTVLSLITLIAQPGHVVSVVYPATGLAAALMWGYGLRWWPAALLAHFVLSYRGTSSAPVSLYVAGIELTVGLLFCLSMERFNVARSLSRVRDLAIFIGTAIGASAIGGLLAGVGELAFEDLPRQKVLFDAASFWLSDFVSILVFVPLLLGWRRWPFASRTQFVRWAALAALLVAIGAGIAIGGHDASPVLFLLLPLVVFSAVVSGVAGTAASGMIMLVTLIGLSGRGDDTPFDSIVRVVFVGTATATGYILAVVWNERELGARRLIHLAHHDPLTGMYNRHELEERLSRAVTNAQPLAHALLYLDLDQFKLVNDTCGHMAGDRMLQQLAVQLQLAAPKDVIFARLGGDEFACIVPNASKESAAAVASMLREATEQFRFVFGSMTFGVGVSIGITFFPADDRDEAGAVLGRADIACHMAKEDGRNRSHVYLPADEVMLRWHSAMHEVSQLELAMENGSLQLYRQSIIDLTRQDSSPFYEVLLRLEHDGDVRVSAEFLPVAQRFGLMDRIDRWVVERACEFLASCGDPKLRLSVNVTGSTLNDPSFFDHVISLPDRFGFDPTQLCLEVTEGVMIHRLRQAVDAMNGLRERGFDLALDDFGAGVASFAYLQELPVTYVKLDGRFVRDLTTDPAAEVIIGSLVRLARLREIECIAEWVDSQETIDRLSALGVRYAQGFFLHHPVPLGLRRLRVSA